MELKENTEPKEKPKNVFAGFYAMRDSEPMFAYQLDSVPLDAAVMMAAVDVMNSNAKKYFKQDIEYLSTESNTYTLLNNEIVATGKECMSEDDKNFLSRELMGLNASLRNNRLTIYYGGLESVVSRAGDDIKVEQNSYFPNSASYKTHNIILGRIKSNINRFFPMPVKFSFIGIYFNVNNFDLINNNMQRLSQYFLETYFSFAKEHACRVNHKLDNKFIRKIKLETMQFKETASDVRVNYDYFRNWLKNNNVLNS